MQLGCKVFLSVYTHFLSCQAYIRRTDTAAVDSSLDQFKDLFQEAFCVNQRLISIAHTCEAELLMMQMCENNLPECLAGKVCITDLERLKILFSKQILSVFQNFSVHQLMLAIFLHKNFGFLQQSLLQSKVQYLFKTLFFSLSPPFLYVSPTLYVYRSTQIFQNFVTQKLLLTSQLQCCVKSFASIMIYTVVGPKKHKTIYNSELFIARFLMDRTGYS